MARPRAPGSHISAARSVLSVALRKTHSPCTAMRLVALLITALLLPLVPDSAAFAQAPDAKPRIEWEVKNRFRLFRNEADFQRHLASWRDDGVLGSERRLATESDGRGWARDTVERLCVDRAGRLSESWAR